MVGVNIGVAGRDGVFSVRRREGQLFGDLKAHGATASSSTRTRRSRSAGGL
jgi:hypothetical protein